jgi:hypothetical protein
MSSLRPESERRICGALCITFSAFLLALLALEQIFQSERETYTFTAEFLQMSNISYVGSLFLAYLILGALGLIGALGVIEQYGHKDNVMTHVVRLSGLAFFLLSYWVWGSIYIVQHKITTLTPNPLNPPDWLRGAYEASAALYSISGWGRLGPAMIFYFGLALMLWRGARLLPRTAAGVFAGIAVLHFLELIYMCVHGGGVPILGEATTLDIADRLMWFGDLAGFVLAGAALITEKGVFARSKRF